MAPPPPAPRRKATTVPDPKPLAGDWLTATEIVDLPIPAVQHKTFENWRNAKRYGQTPFPDQDHTFGSVPVWHLSRVEAWMKATGTKYDLRVWRLKLELGSYLRNPANYHTRYTPPEAAKIRIPAKKTPAGNWVTIPEIADLPVPAVKVSTVEMWRVRHGPDSPTPFPVPDNYCGVFPIWRIERITAWLDLTGKPWSDELLKANRAADLYRRPTGKDS